jgi:hypothetical protein
MVSYPPLTSSTVTPVTVANSVVETVISKLTVPAGMAKVGSSYSGTCQGVVSTAATGSPQLTAQVRVGGLAGVSVASIVIPAIVAQSNVSFFIGYDISCTATGSAGTWIGSVFDIDVLTGPAANITVAPTPVSMSTLVSNDLVLTITWGAAISGNSATAMFSTFGQVA